MLNKLKNVAFEKNLNIQAILQLSCWNSLNYKSLLLLRQALFYLLQYLVKNQNGSYIFPYEKNECNADS